MKDLITIAVTEQGNYGKGAMNRINARYEEK